MTKYPSHPPGHPLHTVSPLDGRYHRQSADLAQLCSEFALFRYRLQVQLKWLCLLADCPELEQPPPLNPRQKELLAALADNFDHAGAARIKELEQQTRHDLKACEYFLKEQLAAHSELKGLPEFVHFACTSEDVNNIAWGLMVADTRRQLLLPVLENLLKTLETMAVRHAALPMLARTHGQAASPTTMGKEWRVFHTRLARQCATLQGLPLYAKCNGASGNYNAHLVAFPEVNWPRLAESFVSAFGLAWNPHTTQIEPRDSLAELLHTLVRINNVLGDLCRDAWGYISLGYLRSGAKSGETGSSTMPHKINPIDFENAEGNLGLANALLEHLAGRLTRSRWQRDLRDSTLLRNLGVAFGHSLLGWDSLQIGLGRVEADEDALARDLDQHWEVLAEAIQTVMRRHGCPQPYERLQELTQGKAISRRLLHDFIDASSLPQKVREQLKTLTPATYLGNAAAQARNE